jgi:hypothetical protein
MFQGVNLEALAGKLMLPVTVNGRLAVDSKLKKIPNEHRITGA